jgi:hypothetical protein
MMTARGTPEAHCAASLLRRDFHASDLGVVHPLEVDQMAAFIHNGNYYVPFVLEGVGLRRGCDLLGNVKRQRLAGSELRQNHRRKQNYQTQDQTHCTHIVPKI